MKKEELCIWYRHKILQGKPDNWDKKTMIDFYVFWTLLLELN